ncbi:sodium/glucose cotransporter 4-like isoform X2 [Limulus polyphemus]|uniref:Sodium/glucose cotransporter 4-like isoform X2 n=1 Tax=Limulus polyphemus TaxID=6850 RepID=A0ABM1SRM6_LIMPO|nr:sodium/glucose cotransporter 4-like isoform X2 [Limulus polyphemus]
MVLCEGQTRQCQWVFLGQQKHALDSGLAGAGASSGIGMAVFELNAIFVLLIMGWIFLPVFMAAGVFTMPEYMQRRFGGQRIRIYLSVLYLFLCIFTKISADLYAGAVFIKQAFDWDLYISVVTLLLISAMFTITGGLKAVIMTDFVQTLLIVGGATGLMILSFQKVGGYSQLIHKYLQAHPNKSFVGYDINNESCSKVPDDYMHILREPTDPVVPWPGTIFGLTIISVWHWCFDQVFVQRVLSAKNVSHAKAGCVMAGYLKILPMFLIVFPGMAARILFTDEVACSSPEVCEVICGSRNGCTNIAYSLLVIRLMPTGASGLMLAVMMAALVTSLTSVFNSSSTLFAIDIWNRFRPRATEIEVLVVGRVFIIVHMAISIAWIPIVEQAHGSQLFHYTQSVSSYLSPPVCAIFILALLWERINEIGAFSGLMAGFILGMARFIMDFFFIPPPCGDGKPDLRPFFVSKIHYLHFAIILFVVSAVTATTVSLLTKPIDKKYLYGLTFGTRRSTQVRADINLSIISLSQSGLQGPHITEEKQDTPISLETTEMKFSSHKEFQSGPGGTSKSGLPWWKRVVIFMCGVNLNREPTETKSWHLSPQEQIVEAEKFLLERCLWQKVCNVNGIVLFCVGVFLYTFFA